MGSRLILAEVQAASPAVVDGCCATSESRGPTALRLGDDGWLDGARAIPSPNFDARPDGATVDLLVVHAISLPPDCFGGDDIIRLFTNTLDPHAHPYFEHIAALRVSAHFLIRRDGELIQFVSCRERAWHAGVSCWQGRERCNDFSVGIELEGCDTCPFEPVQYGVLAQLVAALAQVFPGLHLSGHADIAPGRKTDPGPCFEWPRLALALHRHGVLATLPVQDAGTA